MLLRDLKRLNSLLTKRKTAKVWQLLTLYSKKPSRPALTTPKVLLAEPPVQDPDTLRKSKIVHDYIVERQSKNLLPQIIPRDYKYNLIEPLAVHEDALRRLHRIEVKLARGAPKVSINYTAAGKARIWFVRSALNKGKRQSKALGRLIRLEKKKSQLNLNHWESCHENSIWAWHEAIWEHYMETGIILSGGPERILNSEPRAVPSAQGPKAIRAISEWLEPIRYSLNILREQSARRAKFYEHYKHANILQGAQQYFENKTALVYENKKRRFGHMLEKDLPYVTPFFNRQNLPYVMKSHKF